MKNPAEFVLQAGYGPDADKQAFIQSIKQLGYSDTPDYAYLRKLLHSAKSSIGKQTVSSSHNLTVESNETGVISPPTLHSLPTKKPRGRPPGSSPSKQLENISPGSTVNSTNHASKRNAVKSLHASSPNKKSTPVESTSLIPKSGLPNSGSGDTSPPSQQRIRTRLIDLFSDSDDDNDSDDFFASLKKNSSRSRKDVLESTPKLESPKASPSTRKNHQHLTDNASKQSPFKSPQYTSLVANRRRSGWCQTSPELLDVAKAEALGRSAVK
uniref:Uncharacterized protein n=1 Tax=Trichobilharzia regenti TaxID=157069 RepID=A0AA85JKH4_TRIRE